MTDRYTRQRDRQANRKADKHRQTIRHTVLSLKEVELKNEKAVATLKPDNLEPIDRRTSRHRQTCRQTGTQAGRESDETDRQTVRLTQLTNVCYDSVPASLSLFNLR